jgi:hypothetical protein
MTKTTSTKRVVLFNSKLKQQGGSVLNGIRLSPESNASIISISSNTKGWSKTKIINYILLYCNEHFDEVFKDIKEI